MTKEKQNVVLEDEPTSVDNETVEAVKEEVETAQNTEAEEVSEEEDELSPWYYFYSVGCGFCKKVEPIIEELNNEGHDILFLDMAESDNQKLNQELKKEYNKNCGTPWFINADTGESVCGYREKDILEKWLAGEEIPEPPRLKSQMPKIPFDGSTEEETKKWTSEYEKWLEENNHMGDEFMNRQKSAADIIASPRPKSDPPRPPMGPALKNATDEQLDSWGVEYQKWIDDNSHLPNVQPSTTAVQNMKNRRNQMMASEGGLPPQAQGGQVNNAKINTLEAKVTALEVKIDKLMGHFGVK
tara:strand:- start:528 stop:1424 length:897 start_codon:yes stop_codon:yes gene_type:complete